MPRRRRVLFYIGLLLILVFFWESNVLYPVRMLAVFFHELGHIIAAYSTGGHVKEFVLHPAEGGYVLSRGGNTFWVGIWGYLGSLIFGALILALSDRTKFDKPLAALLGLLIVFIGAAFGETLFTFLFCLIIGAGLFAVALFLPREINDLLLRFLGFAVMLYTPYDVFLDVFVANGYVSDAGLLSSKVGGVPRLWGGIWILVSVAVIGGTLIWLMGKPLPGEEPSHKIEGDEEAPLGSFDRGA
ncbi:MAG: M50 family metallopeptidase [Thermotogae bacterium]|nr:M50 family metallopeptidase [Thermotogota bacterium]